MSDIIQDAKQLLDSATPGPWNIDGAPHPGPDDELFIHPKDDGGVIARVQPLYADAELIAAAPELAQALAEETYFYGVQVWMGGRWIMMLTSNYGTSLMHRGKWFEHKHEAEECAAKWNHDTPTRIVRQRRSPVEDWTANDD